MKTGRLLYGEWSQPEFELLQNIEWEFTEKVDGTNIRIYWDGKECHIRDRAGNGKIQDNLLHYLESTFTPEFLSNHFKNKEVMLFGEGYGHTVQEMGELYRPDKTVGFCLFDIKVGDWIFKRKDVDKRAKNMGLQSVPIVGRGTIHDAVSMCMEGFNSAWGDFTAEGLVIRPVVELKSRSGDRIIAKIKHIDFKQITVNAC